MGVAANRSSWHVWRAAKLTLSISLAASARLAAEGNAGSSRNKALLLMVSSLPWRANGGGAALLALGLFHELPPPAASSFSTS
jgi:hypothetical protein